jgi:hypothetical protein
VETWAAGVTYERSRQARVAETQVEDVYSRVYGAERPELFLKDAAGRRTVGPGATVGVRADSHWTVPEPELALVLGEQGALLGATIGNDLTARDIEGENPLYLPQAKLFAGACAIGPAIVVPDDWGEPFAIEIRIVDASGDSVYEGLTSTDRMKRTLEELVYYLGRDNPVPAAHSPDRNGPGSSGRRRARAGPLGRDPHRRNRHASQSSRLRRRADREKGLAPCRLMHRPVEPGRTTLPASGARAPEATPTRSGTRRARARSWASFPPRPQRTSRPPSLPPPEAFPEWARMPAAQRAGYLTKAADILESRVEEIAGDMTSEMGKPIREARMETARGAQVLRYFAGEAWRPKGNSSSRPRRAAPSTPSVARSESWR